MSSERVIAEVVVAAPAEAVWHALRDPVEIRRWFGWEHDIQGGLVAEIDFIFREHATEGDLELDTGNGRYVLEPRGDETVVRVLRAGGDGYDGIDEGWLTFTQQLRFYLERHRGQDRTTELVEQAGDGEEWFTSAHQRGVVLEDGSLAITTPERVIVSSYA